jgi:hypothetical protein
MKTFKLIWAISDLSPHCSWSADDFVCARRCLNWDRRRSPVHEADTFRTHICTPTPSQTLAFAHVPGGHSRSQSVRKWDSDIFALMPEFLTPLRLFLSVLFIDHWLVCTSSGMTQRCHSWRVKFSGATPNLLGNHIQRMSQLTTNTHEHVLTSPSLFPYRYFPQTRGVVSRDHVVSSCRQSQRPVV